MTNLLDLVPVITLISIAGIAWRGGQRVKSIELKTEQAVKNTQKCEKQLVEHVSRLGNIEGQLSRINGGKDGR